MISPPSAGETTSPIFPPIFARNASASSRPELLGVGGMLEHQRALQVLSRCASRWSVGNVLPGMHRSRGTIPE